MRHFTQQCHLWKVSKAWSLKEVGSISGCVWFQSGYALHVLILWLNHWGQRCYKETAVEAFSWVRLALSIKSVLSRNNHNAVYSLFITSLNIGITVFQLKCCLVHLCFVLYIHDGSLLWWKVPVFCFLHIPLQGAVILLAPGKRVVCRDLLPGFVVGKREWIGCLVLKETLQVSLSQFGGILYSKGIKPLLFFVYVAFPKFKLQVADLGATVFVAGTQKAYKSANNDNAPAQNLQKQMMLSVSDCL